MNLRVFLYSIIIVLLPYFAYADTGGSRKTVAAQRFSTPPVIDGKVDENCWFEAETAGDFRQYNPDHGDSASYQTRVMTGYDDRNIYIAAIMYDPRPDSILQELGPRDTWVNADRFTVQFDTYNNQQNSYNFHITASGVQIDNMRQDRTYDAVWESSARVHERGWSVEIRIPFTELRFPSVNKQVWGLQFKRLIRRYREDAHWSLEPKGSGNTLEDWGLLTGIKNIREPKQIAFRPYLSMATENYPAGQASDWSYSYSGGLDMKIGFNESYVMDMTLLPDFSQVKSDNKVKNLSAFEQTYAERRPFFIKNMNLFHRAGLLYTRRIGATPDRFYEVEDQLKPGEEIENNPSRSQLINAFKVSGRNENGLALGIFNAITGNTYARVKSLNGDTRKIKTDPAENYNIVVADQALKNNSSVYVVNSNVTRSNGYTNSNVTASGFTIHDPSTTYRLHASGVVSEKYTDPDNFTPAREPGIKYHVSAAKVEGNFRLSAYTTKKNEHYDINDMGLNHRNNQEKYGFSVGWRVFEPFWIFRTLNNTISFWSNQRATTDKNENTALRYSFSSTFTNYLSIWGNYSYSLGARYDYYEPRQEGMIFIRPHYESFSINTSTDYRKDLALDAGIYYAMDENSYQEKFFKLYPRLRINDRWFIQPGFRIRNKENDRGYVSKIDSTDNIIFGQRDITTVINSFSSRVMFSNELSLNIWARHYWSVGTYNMFYNLMKDGHLAPGEQYDENADFNYNTVNIDVNFNWEVAPGSLLSLVWKNEIINETDNTEQNLFQSLNHTFSDDQRNSISLKILYYIDYQQIKKAIHQNS